MRLFVIALFNSNANHCIVKTVEVNQREPLSSFRSPVIFIVPFHFRLLHGCQSSNLHEFAYNLCRLKIKTHLCLCANSIFYQTILENQANRTPIKIDIYLLWKGKENSIAFVSLVNVCMSDESYINIKFKMIICVKAFLFLVGPFSSDPFQCSLCSAR